MTAGEGSALTDSIERFRAAKADVEAAEEVLREAKQRLRAVAAEAHGALKSISGEIEEHAPREDIETPATRLRRKRGIGASNQQALLSAMAKLGVGKSTPTKDLAVMAGITYNQAWGALGRRMLEFGLVKKTGPGEWSITPKGIAEIEGSEV